MISCTADALKGDAVAALEGVFSKWGAVAWQIVTPVTGAVVLETAAQYKENNLKPANADSVPTTTSSVPTVPEPGSIICLVLAALVLVFAWMFRARRVCA